jgi:hypothetical protein
MPPVGPGVEQVVCRAGGALGVAGSYFRPDSAGPPGRLAADEIAHRGVHGRLSCQLGSALADGGAAGAANIEAPHSVISENETLDRPEARVGRTNPMLTSPHPPDPLSGSPAGMSFRQIWRAWMTSGEF